VFPAFSSRKVTLGQVRKIGIHFIIFPGFGFRNSLTLFTLHCYRVRVGLGIP